MHKTSRLATIHNALALAVGAAAVLGCGASSQSSPGSDGGDAQPPPVDQAFITDFCAAVAPCCAPNGFTANAATCKASMSKLGISHESPPRTANTRMREATPRSRTAASIEFGLASISDVIASNRGRRGDRRALKR